MRWEDLEVPRVAPRLAAQALVIHDRDDRMMPWTHGATVARHWPGARLLTHRRPRPPAHPRRRARHPRRGRFHRRPLAVASSRAALPHLRRSTDARERSKSPGRTRCARRSRALDARDRVPARDPRRQAAAAADLQRCSATELVEVEPGHAVFEITAGRAALQPDRRGARRPRDDAARLGDGLRGADADARRRRLHHARSEDQPGARDHRRHRQAARHRQDAARRQAHRDRRRRGSRTRAGKLYAHAHHAPASSCSGTG